MLNITRTSKLSIIITTHYIEEARQADCVGLMRNGILLAEDTPINVINRTHAENLEEAFLNLCMKRGASEEAEQSLSSLQQQNVINNNNEFEMQPHENKESKLNKKEARKEENKYQFRWQIVQALLVKNVLQLKRQPG